MSAPVECPSEDDVVCFIEGRVAPSAAERIRVHLDTCNPCRLLLASTLRAESATRNTSGRTNSPQTFPVGEILNRRFRIDRFIARGGMGEVYEAWDLELGETVALKTIVCTGLDNARLFPRIRAEVLLARRITHPNVCRILEFGLLENTSHDQEEAIPFFTMEYLRGDTLKQHLARHGRLSESEVIAIALQILDGLDAVHVAGIVHRDLKPDNVFVVPTDTGQPRAIVMDFGLARSTDEQDPIHGLSSDALVGTPAYMAPEQTLGGPPTTAWDIYALGVMVFELLSGALPFAGKTAVAMAMARMQGSAPSVSSIRPGIHPSIEAVVTRCLQRDPKRRFASAGEVRRALAGIHLSSCQRLWSRPALAGLLAGMVVGMACLALLAVRHRVSRVHLRLGGIIESRARPMPSGPQLVDAVATVPREAPSRTDVGLSAARHQLDASAPDAAAPARVAGGSARRPANPARSRTDFVTFTGSPQLATATETSRLPARPPGIPHEDEVVIPAFAKPSGSKMDGAAP
jgi:serine/threonine protein kinase